MKFVFNVASIYENTVKALNETETRPAAKVYNNLNTMLEECYLVGATKFGHNFIA